MDGNGGEVLRCGEPSRIFLRGQGLEAQSASDKSINLYLTGTEYRKSFIIELILHM